MITIRFPDEQSERRALGFLAGRYSFKSLATGETIVAPQALPALALEGISFLVEGRASYEQLTATVRNPAAPTVQ